MCRCCIKPVQISEYLSHSAFMRVQKLFSEHGKGASEKNMLELQEEEAASNFESIII